MFEETDPITDLRAAAVAMHEMYEELRGAGFTRREGIQLVAEMTAAGASAAEADAAYEEEEE